MLTINEVKTKYKEKLK